MAKRHRSNSSNDAASLHHKRPRKSIFSPIKVATVEAAQAVDNDPPLARFLRVCEETTKQPVRGDSVVYWMRMSDLRVNDNRALSMASARAKKEQLPLIVIFVLSPQDYIAHDRSRRRIDFTLRNLSKLKATLAPLNIPLHTITHQPRRTIPACVVDLLKDFGCTKVFANIEYEIDELRRDHSVCELAKKEGIQATFVHNKCIVEPGVILTKENKAYAVYSPYRRNWLSVVNRNISHHLEDCPLPDANLEDIHASSKFMALFDTPVPSSLDGFELEEADRQKMIEIWPEGEDAAAEILKRFLTAQSKACQLGAVNPLTDGIRMLSKSTRISNYRQDRDRADKDTTSRLSVYLSSGVISARACVRATMAIAKSAKVDGNGDSGIGCWIQELAWRDFYTSILAGFPRVSMGRPFLEKFSAVVWENHQSPSDVSYNGTHEYQDSENLRKWKEGRTGVPIVDAAMRCIKEMGWLHNRARMITAMFLTKHLMIDWRVGERYFMEQLIDGDLASNNGGWQWCASTGVDACPYFRIFNPYKQSEKADPTGEFIRHWVPELRKLRGPDLHNPSASVADKLGYPRPIVQHEEARQRALRRFKNPGDT